MKHNYLFIKLLSTLTFSLLFCFITVAQTIKGKVTDANTQESLVGATVLLKETGKTTAVQLDGYFTFKMYPQELITSSFVLSLIKQSK